MLEMLVKVTGKEYLMVEEYCKPIVGDISY